MKRTTVMLDETLVEEATRLSGEKTHSAVIRRALETLVRSIRARGILELAGSGEWKGDLATMRGDAAPGRRRRLR